MRTALLSVWEKRGIAALGRLLSKEGWRLVASGGTAGALREADLKVTSVSALTGEPEMFDGRVKTLHPAIYAGLLCRDSQLDREALAERGWSTINLVVVNLYPFEEVISEPGCSLAEALEHIDIGGVTLLRAAAKNYPRVTVICDPEDYPEDLSSLEDYNFRQRMAAKAFERTASYDSAIQTYFAGLTNAPAPVTLRLHPVQELRYGENPHQEAAFLALEPDGTPMGGRLLGGKPLSYNNLLDLEAAWRGVQVFERPAVVVVKHASPCGIASAKQIEAAIGPAIASDPISAFGSVIAANQQVNRAFIEGLGDLFVECIAAPSFSEEALEMLEKKPNLRILAIPGGLSVEKYEYRSIQGGFLRQSSDQGDPDEAQHWQVVTQRTPAEKEMNLLRFAWKAVQPVKSNAVLLAKDEGSVRSTVGIGGGQPNRVDCVEIAGKHAGQRASGAVMASDGFFPFPDGIEAAARLGVTAVIQPGGSRNDRQVISRADELGLAMVFTGVRHFRH